MTDQDKQDLITLLMFAADSFDSFGVREYEISEHLSCTESEAKGYLDSLNRLRGSEDYSSIFTREFWESKLSQ